ncbi:DNA polymerase III, delta subunit [Roseovarius mucosus DSM 17069]|uniref:DNA-directed DNA polymerase n=1 Tax=Roseovarius mucosus DSM 17069 TaxID=1288298 RepID=A0A0A0HLY9_9RHOB|nr:DNA polymerase III subunit delta [Roseovarius mucosus]KGM87699.1 DNA polymerase III, delta subunit [Roseovarius mucosus DSM 17069]
MKLSPRDAVRYFAKPEAQRTGILIYGADAMRVALRRQELLAALLGPTADEEMRLSRMPAGDLRKDPAALMDAVKAQGFFPGPRAAFVEDANDTAADAILAALGDWREGDAQIIVTAGALKATSRIRKAFEGHPNAYAVGIYDDPPSREEIEATLARAGLRDVPGPVMSDLTALARDLDPGDFRQTIEKLALYKLGDATPLSAADIAACAPASTEADLDDILNIVAEGRSAEIGPVMRRLKAQGTQPVGLCIGATRHFRALYTAASDPGGAAQGIARMRPPIFGPRRDRMLRQAQGWGAERLQQALTILTDTDLTLRSAGQRAPEMALVERALIRLAMLAGAR